MLNSTGVNYIPHDRDYELGYRSQVEKIIPLHLFFASKVYFVSPQWITQVKLMSRRNVQIQCILSPLLWNLSAVQPCSNIWACTYQLYLYKFLSICIYIFKHIYIFETTSFLRTVSREEKVVGVEMPCWSSNVKAKLTNEYESPKLKDAEEISYRIRIFYLELQTLSIENLEQNWFLYGW